MFDTQPVVQQPDALDTPLALDTFAPPAGFTPERHRELMGWRRWAGLPTVLLRDYSEEPVAFVFTLAARRRGLRYDDPQFMAARKAVTQLTEILKDSWDPLNAELFALRSHKHCVTVSAPITCVGTYGINEAWNRGFQRARMLQDVFNAHVSDHDSKVVITNSLLPGITRDGYMTSYPDKIWSYRNTPYAGGSIVWEVGHYAKDVAKLAGDEWRKNSLDALLKAQPEKAKWFVERSRQGGLLAKA